MDRTTVLAGLAAALIALSAPAMAGHKSAEQGWQPPWDRCEGWNCGRPGWQDDWQPGWQGGWGHKDDGKGRHGKPRLVPKDVIARQLWQHGYQRIYDIRLDDDGVVYKVRAWDWRGRLTKLFFDARTGRFIRREFAD